VGRLAPGDPSPHHSLGSPVGEPDPTEWPDPYEDRPDPRDPPDPDRAPFGEESQAGRTEDERGFTHRLGG
jgi:hypothetical protein